MISKKQLRRLVEAINHILADEQDTGLTPVDKWKATDCMYLEDMGFKNDGTYHYCLKNPEIRLSHKKGEGFKVQDVKKNDIKTFPKFKQLEEFFANYNQEFDDTPYN